MAHMTDEEAKRLDEKWTKNPPKPGPNGTGTDYRINITALPLLAAFSLTLACAYGTVFLRRPHAKGAKARRTQREESKSK